MKARFLAWVWLVGPLVMAEETPVAPQVVLPPGEAKALDRVVSQSGQFRASGGDAMLRGTVAMLADEAKTELLQLTGEKDEWKVPVSIILHGKQGDPLPPRTVNLRLVVVGGVSELILDVHLSRGIEQERFKRAVTAALIYERALRNTENEAAGGEMSVPPWLAEGLREATAWRLKQSDRRLYEALFERGGVFKTDDLFSLNERTFENLDAATHAAFRVSSGALVMALLEQPQGKDGFRAFLSDVAAYEGEMPGLLRKHFPELNLSETSLAKWWALQLANMGGRNLATDVLTIPQTEAALAEALQLNFRTKEGIIQQKDISAWPELAGLDEPERVAAVRIAQDALVRLSYRCFPSYRPLLSDYQAVLHAIAKNNTKDVMSKLVSLDETRTTMVSRADHGRDYLDWFEITRARETSGVFDDYLRLKERLKENPGHRDDGVSNYLDRMDEIFDREENKDSAR
jgi:hypothetical protein